MTSVDEYRAEMARERIASIERELRAAIREQALHDAARLVCRYCCGPSLPDRKVHGPNEDGTYYHRIVSGPQMCEATAIYARIRWEK